jgi:hypothetical protein
MLGMSPTLAARKADTSLAISTGHIMCYCHWKFPTCSNSCVIVVFWHAIALWPLIIFWPL